MIANRGEIAIRIARTAKKMGISTVGIYSEPDHDALHAQACDSAFLIGPASLSDSYLCIDKIICLAKEKGVDAIHPGYGFLSENPEFAKECEINGIQFIGPSPTIIKLMGMKNEAKSFLEKLEIPIVAGYHGEDQADLTLLAKSKKIGFPLLIKAAAGGGGRGLRLVDQYDEFFSALESARREALSGFGNDSVILEKFVASSRHIEVQIFGDQFGNVIHLFERDCSLQRKHQKVIEEAPATISSKVRQELGKTAVKIAKSVNYVGAGTVEFILADDDSFYFIEMNTRLQVEHPVTEEITNLDLVEWQFRIARGERLPLVQNKVQMSGHAIEARVYAEVPEKEFLPATGEILHLKFPDECDNIRLEIGVKKGDYIGVNYDSMIAKVIVKNKDRQSALVSLQKALSSFCVFGVDTNVSFLQSIISKQQLTNSNDDGTQSRTSFIEDNLLELVQLPPSAINAALMVAAFYDYETQTKFGHGSQGCADDLYSPWVVEKSWRLNLPKSETFDFFFHEEKFKVLISINPDGTYGVAIGDQQFHISRFSNDERLVLWCGDTIFCDAEVFQHFDSISVFLSGRMFRFEKLLIQSEALMLMSGGICSPLPGVVTKLFVESGKQVKTGESLMVIEAMKMEHEIKAPIDGRVSGIYFGVGDKVDEGVELILVEDDR